LLALAFWMHLRNHGEDSQASSRVVHEKVVPDETEPLAPKAIMTSHLASP
jgi:hypothetical protein